MTSRHIAFAVPGDLKTLTGGYIYDRRVIHELRALGWTVDHIALPDGFPNPSPDQMRQALDQLQHLPQNCPVIIDGLAFGAMDCAGVAALRCPVIALVHHPLAKENGLSPDRQTHLHQTEKQNLSQVAGVIVPSPHTADILATEYNVAMSRITIAKPGIDQPTQAGTPTSPPLILSVGIQLPRKGHDVLLRALAQIKDQGWQAKIVGAPLDPVYAGELTDLRNRLGLAGRVEILGRVDRTVLDELYRKASLFALATRYEGYGIVFDEALVHGLPIVSCLTGAVGNTVPQDAGILVPVDQPSAFATGLTTLLADRRDYAAASLRAGKMRPGWDATATSVTGALAQTLNRLGPTST